MLALVLLGGAPDAGAQGPLSATLRGSVLDSSGSVVPGARVTLANVRTTATRTLTTGAGGGYVFAALAPGPYRLKVERAGFAPWESPELRLSPGDSLQIDATLTLGGQTESIAVHAEREMIRTDQGAQEGLLTSEQIQDLSIVGRSTVELLRVLPGTVTPDQSQLEVVSFTSGANNLAAYSLDGNRGTAMSLALDGSKILDFGSNGTVMLSPNDDMVEEVKVQTGNYAAEYGSPSVQISAVTKGGASSFHGSVYDYWRNWRFAANDRSNSSAGVPRPRSDYHYPGFNLSGPLLVPGTGFNRDRDRLFFFVGYEYQHQVIDPGTTLGVVPTLAQRQGDFSEFLKGEGQNLGQPPTVTIPAGFPGAGQAAPDNDLSPYVDPVGQALLDLYPLPNRSDPDNRYNYAFNTPLPLDRWQLTTRLDWNVSERTHASVRLALEREKTKWSRGLYGAFSNFELPSRVIGDNKAWSVAVNVTSVPSPSLTNELVLSASRLELDNSWEDPSRMSKAGLGLQDFQGVFPSESPDATIGLISLSQGFSLLGAFGPLPIFAHNDSVSFVDTLSKVTGPHTVKLGVFVERGRKQGNDVSGSIFGLAGPWTPGGTGSDYGDLLVGRMFEFQQRTPIPPGRFQFWNFEGYAQDTWKARRNLTLELGLRVSKMPNNEELSGLAARFEPAAYDGGQGAYIDGDPQRPNGILLERRGEIPKGITDSPGPKLMPRLGFAWDLRGDGELILRGGTGLFYNRPMGNWQYGVVGLPPNAFSVDVYWWDALPGGLTTSSLPTIDWTRLGATFDSLDPTSIHIPRTWNWSLALAGRLPWQQTLEVAYVGNRADHLPDQTLANYVPPGTFTGTYGNADLDNPLHRAALDASVVAGFRTFPAYGRSTWYQYEAWSHYHALQATLSRSAGRVQYFVNYTFGKALGTTGDDYALIDPIDPGGRSYGVLLQDRTHIFNASYNVVLPDPIRSEGNAFLRNLLNGWQVSGITSYRSGAPFRVYLTGELTTDPMLLAWWGTDAHLPGDPNNVGAIAPVFRGDPRLGNTGVGARILDIGQIAVPGVGESGPFEQPYDFRLPSRWDFDLTVSKNFTLGGSKRLQLRVGFFNLFNQAAPLRIGEDIDLNLQTECNVRVNGVPNGLGGTVDGVCDPTRGFHFTELTRENFGKIVTERGHRTIELAARFEF